MLGSVGIISLAYPTTAVAYTPATAPRSDEHADRSPDAALQPPTGRPDADYRFHGLLESASPDSGAAHRDDEYTAPAAVPGGNPDWPWLTSEFDEIPRYSLEARGQVPC
jgi:hypothetical protein